MKAERPPGHRDLPFAYSGTSAPQGCIEHQRRQHEAHHQDPPQLSLCQNIPSRADPFWCKAHTKNELVGFCLADLAECRRECQVAPTPVLRELPTRM